jgi:tetrahydromethanopterin S-methyltransferase subunit E
MRIARGHAEGTRSFGDAEVKEEGGLRLSSLRWRFCLEFGLAGVAAILAVLTVLIHDWAEVLFGFEPDEGGGAFEIGVTLVAFVAAVVSQSGRAEGTATKLAAAYGAAGL